MIIAIAWWAVVAMGTVTWVSGADSFPEAVYGPAYWAETAGDANE